MQLPTAFGKYELLQRIATGGMAEVYLARSFGVAGFEKRLVIKRIRPELADDPRFVAMFINEARIGVYLNHPNVVQVHELGRVGRSYYIAMEHIHGRDLTRLVKTLRAVDQRIPLPLTVAIVAEVCRGLAYAHSRTDREGQPLGLVHQDVSPHNVVVTFEGDVKVVDFGIARLIHTASGEATTGGGRPGGGKYAYMSPEQALGRPVDHRSDVFSTGIMLWELIVGHRLYQDPDPAEKLRQVQQATVPHPKEKGVPLDDRLWAILQRALARDPDDRYASSAVFEEDLRAWLFETRQRVDQADIAGLMCRSFPDAADPTLDDLHLSQVVADVERLASAQTPTSTLTLPHPSDLPGRLQRSAGERKTVTVLMVDVDGLTELSGRVEPEVLFKRHYQLIRWIRTVIDRFGGHVQSAIDDHVTVLFGVPRTRVDDLHDALACALELVRRVGELRQKGMSLSLAIGVHTGEVTVSRRRNRIRHVARGDTTRLARKLSAAADHGEILVSERVLASVQGAWVFRKGPAVNERGGAPPSASYLLQGRRPGLRFGGTGPWMRRGDELEVLRSALLALGMGKGGSLAMIGEPGSGKTRFIREIREVALRRGLPFYGVRCATEGSERPMAAFRELIGEVLGLHPEPAPEVYARADRLAQLGLSPRDLQSIDALLGSETRHTPGETETWRALQRVIQGLAREGPLLLAFDDVHHLGPRELAALTHLIAGTVDGPVLFLLTHRGELPSVLAASCAVMPLGPVPLDAQPRLLGHLLQAQVIDDEILRLVARTCEGNPFFIEEMVKYLLDDDQIRVEDGMAVWMNHPEDLTGQPGPHLLDRHLRNHIPHSLAGLVAARIDALDAAAKGTLQLAAIIGHTVDERLLAEAAGLDDPTPLLLELSSHGLLTRQPGSEGWAFGSDLVREVALRGILGVQRRDYHRLVAHAYEALYPEQLDDRREVLARHCVSGGRWVDAVRHAFLAGQALERSQYLDRARSIYRLGLQAVRQIDDPDQWDTRVQGDAMLHLRIGAVSLLLGDTPQGEHALHLSLDIASDAGLPWIEVRAHLELGRTYAQRGRAQLAAAHLGQARALVQFEEDDALRRETLEAAAGLAFDEGRNDEAQALWHQALQLAGDDPAAIGRCEMGLANRFLRSGDHEQAEPMLRRVLTHARAAGDRILEGRVLNNIGLLHSWAGDLDQARSYYRRALEVREGIGYTRGVVINHHNIGDTHFRAGLWAHAHVAFTRSRELAAEMGWTRGVVLNDVYLAYIDIAQDEGELDSLLQATERARALGDVEIATTGAWLAGRTLLQRGDRAEARRHLHHALQDAQAWDLAPMAALIEELLAEAEDPPPAPLPHRPPSPAADPRD